VGTARADPAENGARSESFLRAEGRFLAPVLALLLLAGALIGVGIWTGLLETDGGLRIAAQPEQPDPVEEQTTPAAVEPQILALTDVPTTFDPFGSGVERPGDLPLLVDGDPDTFWRTERYNSRAFGNLKPGVGFYLDLGAPQRIDTVALRTVSPGVSLEIRVADSPSPDLDGWRVVGGVQQAQQELIEIQPEADTVARYILVWLVDELPQFEGRFAAGFSQIAVTGTPP
jgi:hypothetical protein